MLAGLPLESRILNCTPVCLSVRPVYLLSNNVLAGIIELFVLHGKFYNARKHIFQHNVGAFLAIFHPDGTYFTHMPPGGGGLQAAN